MLEIICAYAPYMGKGGVVGQGLERCEEGNSKKGMHPTLGLVSVEGRSVLGAFQGHEGIHVRMLGAPLHVLLILEFL